MHDKSARSRLGYERFRFCACVPPCAKLRKLFSSAKCATSKRRKLRSKRLKQDTWFYQLCTRLTLQKRLTELSGCIRKTKKKLFAPRLAQTFRYIVSQRLIPKADGKGRVAAVEILKSNPRTREYIEKGESNKAKVCWMRCGRRD